MQTDIYCIGKNSGVHFPHRIICNTVVLFEIGVCCAVVQAESLRSPLNKTCGFQILHRIICSFFLPISVSIHIWSFQGMGCYFLTVENTDLTFLGSQIGNPITTGETVQGTYPKVSQATCYCLYLSDTKLDFCVFATVLKRFKNKKQHWVHYSLL